MPRHVAVVVKNRKLIEEYGERAKKLLVEAFKDTTIPAIAAHVRNLAKPGKSELKAPPHTINMLIVYCQ